LGSTWGRTEVVTYHLRVWSRHLLSCVALHLYAVKDVAHLFVVEHVLMEVETILVTMVLLLLLYSQLIHALTKLVHL
jgi:hypothetical protein